LAWSYILMLISGIWLLDRGTKILVAQNLTLGSTIPLIDNWVTLTYVQNRGAAYGILQNQVLLLSLVSIVLVAILVYGRKRWFNIGKLGDFAFALILGGALGNLYDRLMLGYVIDFLNIQIIPVFNVADSAITIGAGLLILAAWHQEQRGNGRDQA
jgi:signal peptidase II